MTGGQEITWLNTSDYFPFAENIEMRFHVDHSRFFSFLPFFLLRIQNGKQNANIRSIGMYRNIMCRFRMGQSFSVGKVNCTGLLLLIICPIKFSIYKIRMKEEEEKKTIGNYLIKPNSNKNNILKCINFVRKALYNERSRETKKTMYIQN